MTPQQKAIEYAIQTKCNDLYGQKVISAFLAGADYGFTATSAEWYSDLVEKKDKRIAELSALIEQREGEIGKLIEGEHLDELKPRAESWMQERRNWIKEVALLRMHIIKLDGEAIEFKNWCDKITAMLDEDGDTIVNTYSGLDYNKSYTTQQLHALFVQQKNKK